MQPVWVSCDGRGSRDGPCTRVPVKKNFRTDKFSVQCSIHSSEKRFANQIPLRSVGIPFRVHPYLNAHSGLVQETLLVGRRTGHFWGPLVVATGSSVSMDD